MKDHDTQGDMGDSRSDEPTLISNIEASRVFKCYLP